MKTKLFPIFVLFLFLGLKTHGQQYSDSYITTHNQTNVTAGTLTSSDYNWLEKLNIKNYFLNSYNVTYLSEATLQYNCHFYAWFNTEQYPNNRYWVNLPQNSWRDYSFVQTSNEHYPGKVTYSTANDTLSHSAITTSNAGVYISKWGPACRFLHAWDECPYYVYADTIRKYYERFVLTGPSYIYCQPTYLSIPNTTGEGYSINWSACENFNIDNSTNSYIIVSPIASGQGVVASGVYKSGYFPRHLEYSYSTVFAGTTQAPTGINSTELCSNSEVDFWVEDYTNPPYMTTYNWNLWDGDGEIINGQGSFRITVATGETGYLPITVTAITDCGESDPYFEEFYIDYCGERSSFIISPNPTTDKLKITAQYDLLDRSIAEIYNSKMDKVKSITLTEKEYTFDVSDLPKGVYMIIINNKEHRSVQKFIKQ
jgi:hypothetical protein